MTIAKIINQYTKSLFDIGSAIYRSVVADETTPENATITNPNDFNAGAIANVIEWIRRLSLSLIDQLFLNKATGDWLNYIVQGVVGLFRFVGEDDSHLIQRIQEYILGYKVSPAAIIYYTREFSPNGEPEIIQIIQESAFADVSFASYYGEFQVESSWKQDWWVLPALSATSNSGIYYFILRLYGTNPNDVKKVIDKVNRWKAGGIGYTVQIL